MSGHHILPKRLYVGIFLALMVLTGVTVGVTYVDLGELNLIVALAVAITKAMLVILFFMEVKYGPKLIKVTFGAGFVFFAIMIIFTMMDYMTRTQYGLPAFPQSAAPPAGTLAAPAAISAPAVPGATAPATTTPATPTPPPATQPAPAAVPPAH